jgi:hypothetical protein
LRRMRESKQWDRTNLSRKKSDGTRGWQTRRHWRKGERREEESIWVKVWSNKQSRKEKHESGRRRSRNSFTAYSPPPFLEYRKRATTALHQQEVSNGLHS